MTAEEIRAISETIKKIAECEPLHQATPTMGYSSSQFVVLREIAAQLADLNSNLNSFVKQQLELQLDFMRGDVR